jgi:hypothetical protein
MNGENSGDFWDEWGNRTGPSQPVPAGKYTCQLKECNVDLSNANGVARTSCTFVVQDGDHAGRYLWLDWPHIGEKFGWCARMMWTAMGGTSRPNGEQVEQVFMEVARCISDRRGLMLTVETDVRTYKNNQNEIVSKSRVKHVGAIELVSAPTGEAPNW